MPAPSKHSKRKNMSNGPKITKKLKILPPRPVSEAEEEEEDPSSDSGLDKANSQQQDSDDDMGMVDGSGEEDLEGEGEGVAAPGDAGRGNKNSISERESTPVVLIIITGTTGAVTEAAAEATYGHPQSITYNMLIFSLTELAKPQRSRREGIARFLDLPNDLEWIDFQSRLTTRVADVLFPGHANVPVNMFHIFFTITRHVPNPLPLASAEDYKHLLKCTGKMKTPTVKIIVNQLIDVSFHTFTKHISCLDLFSSSLTRKTSPQQQLQLNMRTVKVETPLQKERKRKAVYVSISL